MLGIEPDLLARGRRPAGASRSSRRPTARPRRPACSPRRCGRTGPRSRPTTPAPTCRRASPPGSPASRTATSRSSRSTSGGCPKVVDPLDAELLVLGNLTRDQLDRYGEVRADRGAVARGVLDPPRRSRSSPNASDPHVVWAAEPAKPTWIALGAPWRSDAATCPRCAALLDLVRRPLRLPGVRLRPAGDAEPARRRRARARRRAHPACRCSSPARWNRMNAALALTAAVHPLRRARSGARVAGLASVEVVSGRFSTRRLPDGRDARVLLAKNPAGWTEVLRWLQESERRRRRARGERARRRRPGPVVAVGRALRAAARPARRRQRRARPRRRGAARLRRRRLLRRARPARGRGAAPGRHGRHHRVVHAVLRT